MNKTKSKLLVTLVLFDGLSVSVRACAWDAHNVPLVWLMFSGSGVTVSWTDGKECKLDVVVESRNEIQCFIRREVY